MATVDHRLSFEQPIYDLEARLQQLSEREAGALGVKLDSPKLWEVFYSKICAPIRSAFWYGWEQIHQLEVLYQQEYARHEADRSKTMVLRVARRVHDRPLPPAKGYVPSTLPDTEELTVWEAVAAKLFEEMRLGDEDALWELPPPEQVLGKPK